MIISSLLLAQEPKKKRKETKEIPPEHLVVDTVTVSRGSREPLLDSLSLEQKKQIRELEERVEQQKVIKK